MNIGKPYSFLFYSICFFGSFLWSERSKAQQVFLSAGSSFTSNIGSISQSIGLVQNQYNTNSSGQIMEGVLFNYELIEIPTSIESGITLDIKAYPNPVTDELYITLSKNDLSLNFLITDVKGRVKERSMLNSSDQAISLKNYNAGLYILQIYSNTDLIKSFKLIKN